MELLQNPVIEGILAAIIFISILIEIKTAGFSGGGFVAALFGMILLWSHWYTTEWLWAETLLFFGGMALIFLDLLFLASGAAAVAGLVSMAASLYFLFGADLYAMYILTAGFIAAIAGLCFLAGRLSTNSVWKKISLTLNLTSQKGYISSVEDLSRWNGWTGKAKSVLRPAGKVEIDGQILDAVSQGDFIEAGKTVVVVRTESNRIVVKEKV